MQTYAVYHLLRTNVGRVGLWLCLILSGFLACAGSHVPGPSAMAKDSLFAQWNKTKSTLPTLIYRIQDFDDYSDRVEVESLIRTYGIGGVILRNGNKEEVQQWVNDNQNSRSHPILYAVEIEDIFELPFDDLHGFPNQLTVECLTDSNQVYQLGLAHAYELHTMGIGLVEFSDLPPYYTEHEVKKMTAYFEGLKRGQISYFFSGKSLKSPVYQSIDTLTKPNIIDVRHIQKSGELDKKTIKNYRKQSGDTRMVIDFAREPETTIAQIERGVGLITISRQSGSQQLINALLLDEMPNSRCFKKEVREYFGLINSVEIQLKEFTDTEYGEQFTALQYLRSGITLVQDPGRQVPIKNLSGIELFTISNDPSNFSAKVDKYKRSTHLPLSVLAQDQDSLLKMLPAHAYVLADLSSIAETKELEDVLGKCEALGRERAMVAFYTGHSELLKDFTELSLLWAPDFNPKEIATVVEMVFGARSIRGALPGYLTDTGSRRGESRQAIGRLIYQGEESFSGGETLTDRIDSLVHQAIQEGMMPGCQIMMVKDGRVVYDRSFGYLTYDSLSPVRWDHLYDIASVTKTVATVPAIMERMEHGEISLTGELGEYLTAYEQTDKAHLTVDDILTHQSGLKSYIPFWRHAKYNSDSASFLYKKKKWRRKYQYLSASWPDSIQAWIAKSSYNSLSNEDGTYRYLYSDLGFMLMKDVVESSCSCTLDQSVNELVYRPMGMDFTAFNPLNQFQKEQIAPTEQDSYFRSHLLRGEVHDKNAALLDGIAGHAGLFSNANDLAKYMQMLLQGGSYGGVRYFPDSLIHLFTSKKHLEDRRALGWDKPYPSVGNASRYASDESFGHSGFTGTLIWADPKYDLIYIFLSNRIYPDPQNYKLIKSNTRTKIHDIMYESFLEIDKNKNQDI